MLRLVNSEWFRLRQRAMPWILIGIFAAILLLFYMLMWFVMTSESETTTEEMQSDLQDQLRIGAVPDSGLQLVEQFGAIFVVILASSIIATEFTWGTIRTILPHTSGRAPFLTAKLLVMLAFAAVVVVAGFVVALASSALVTRAENLDSSLPSSFWLDSLAGMGRVLFAMLPFVALAAMASLWTRSSAAAIGLTLGVLFLEPLIMAVVDAAGGPLAHVPEAFLSRNVEALVNAGQVTSSSEQSFGETAADLPNAWQAGMVLGAYTAAFCGLAYWRFMRRDVQVG